MRATAIIGSLAVMIASAAAAAPTPTVDLTELGAQRWRLEYRLDAPASALFFTRAAPGYRQAYWRAPGFTLVTARDGLVRVERRDGAPFDRLVVDIDARYAEIARNYAPFAPFSDGGMLVYTGYFHACADAPCTQGAVWRVRVTPLKRRAVLLRGERVAGGAFDDRGDGANVYVGAGAPVRNAAYVALVDRALSAPFRRAFEETTPRLVALFDDRLGALPVRPAFSLSVDPAPGGRDYESRGAALPDEVSIHLLGAGWTGDAASVEPGFLAWYFAHETAHLYQRVEDRSITDSFMAEAWVQEGGAEALAAIAVETLDRALVPYARERVRRAAAACSAGLAALKRPLNASDAAGAFDNYYACGLAMQSAIDADVRRNSDGARDLFDVWRAFLDDTRSGAPWTGETFLAAAARAGASSETLRLVGAVARTRAASAQAALMDRLLAAPDVMPERR